MDERKKLRLADFVIRNDGSKQTLFTRLNTFHIFIQKYLKEFDLKKLSNCHEL
jgi:dephospho-CoA kinase